MIKRLLFSVFLLITLQAAAQDTHYWSANFSAGSFVMPGGVVANNRDSGVVFYNPALLAYSKKNSASISGNLYQWQLIKIKDGTGMGKDLRSVYANIIPVMGSGTLHLNLGKAFTIGYAFLHDPQINYQAHQQGNSDVDILDQNSPGKESFLGQYSVQNKASYTSSILSVGFKVSEKIAIGVTGEAGLRHYFFSGYYSSRAFRNNGRNSSTSFVSAHDSYQADYYHLGLRFKVGMSYDDGPNHLGLLVTTPMMRLYGKGSILSDVELNNLFPSYVTRPINLLANARQTNLTATWKMPVSVAFGYARDFNDNKGQINFTTEYFKNVPFYNILTPTNDFFARGSAVSSLYTADLLKLTDARRAVVNFGVGVSYLFRPDLTGYASVRTDMSYASDALNEGNTGYQYNATNWNNIRWQLGTNVKKRRFNLRTGFMFAYGYTNNYKQSINFDSPTEENILEGELGNTRAHHFSMGLLFAYIYNF